MRGFPVFANNGNGDGGDDDDDENDNELLSVIFLFLDPVIPHNSFHLPLNALTGAPVNNSSIYNIYYIIISGRIGCPSHEYLFII